MNIMIDNINEDKLCRAIALNINEYTGDEPMPMLLIKRAVLYLSTREKKVIYMRRVKELSSREVAAYFDVSGERIRKLEALAYIKCRLVQRVIVGEKLMVKGD